MFSLDQDCTTRLPSCLKLNRVLSVWWPLGSLDTLLPRSDGKLGKFPEFLIVAMNRFCSSRSWLRVFAEPGKPQSLKTETENR